MANEKYDLIVFGSTGFTGRLVAEYLQKQYGEGGPSASDNIKWAMAGRSAEKLEQVRDEMGISQDIDLLVADSDDQSSLDSLVDSAKVVLTTVGPYQLYGEKLLATVVKLGKSYVDLCGEPAWMHQMIAKYQAEAKTNNAHIVFSCGFDSVPFDLGVYFLQQAVIQETAAPLDYVKGRVRKMQGTFSGGTAASLKATMVAAKQDKAIMHALINPYSLATSEVLSEQPRGDKPHFDEKLGSWAAPFIMAAINTKNVHRSNFLLNYAYGKTFKYDEMMLTGPGDKGEAIANHVANDKSLGGEGGPKPGEGPSKEERENGFYDVLFIGEHANGKTYAASVAGYLDPGYGSTSKMITESAICLAEKKESLSGGFYTSAPALGEALIERLQKNAGLVFKIEQA
ncbi:saccharopine dehydrogenase family protein [Glaciecola petra]|uniref:Saccharopine dehydrogenase NADP-binding domain-containing protein n=1 Tax=Glaciecola petra TaxID=3075602 RepID=A0ABU2ZN38_9ALTE|nr:saccharopine dehydrogenase NADP-binding domain-containing protein [Aestuariibacter sp. P117]MDT0594025.1 saccharopine dehydrogenase NADP-binding domain-containing protein [Aestuariibacter sp. P117]